MKLTVAAILVSRGMKFLQAAPAAYPFRSAEEVYRHMNPSYCRIRLPMAIAVGRFAAWNRLKEVGPLVPTDSGNAIRLAVDERGQWRGAAVFVSDLGEWTLFQDFSGALGGVPGASWAKFAGRDDLVMAGYNDSIPYAEMVVVRDGNLIREFLDDPTSPEQNVNSGVTDSEHEPFKTWIDVARFVDEDDLGFREQGWLWVWPKQAEPKVTPD